MQKKDQLLLINEICDGFESQLKAEKPVDIGSTLAVAKSRYDSPDFLDSLLAELITLQIVYSRDRESTAAELKSEFPNQLNAIEQAISLPSLMGTIDHHHDDTKVDTAARTEKSRYPEIRSVGTRYAELKHLASGGLGDVYVGYDKSVRRPVAVKMLKPTLVFNAEAKQRFVNEVAITGGLEPGNHPSLRLGRAGNGATVLCNETSKGRHPEAGGAETA